MRLVSVIAAGVITDSLGREWDPIKHPRGRDGKFIRLFHDIRAFLNPHDDSPWASARVDQINADGTIRATVNHVTDAAHNNYIGKQVDLNPSNIESINEKATLTAVTDKAKALDSYGFDKSSLDTFFDAVGLDTKGSGPNNVGSDTDKALQALQNIKAGKDNLATDTPKYNLALAAKVLSGPGKAHSDDDYKNFLEALGVPPDVIDDTPDGMSGLKWLGDKVNAARSPNNNNKDSIAWFDEQPPLDPWVLREAKLKDSDVRVRWNTDGTQSIVWPDGTVEQHDKNEGSLLLAAQGAHAAPGVTPHYGHMYEAPKGTINPDAPVAPQKKSGWSWEDDAPPVTDFPSDQPHEGANTKVDDTGFDPNGHYTLTLLGDDVPYGVYVSDYLDKHDVTITGEGEGSHPSESYWHVSGKGDDLHNFWNDVTEGNGSYHDFITSLEQDSSPTPAQTHDPTPTITPPAPQTSGPTKKDAQGNDLHIGDKVQSTTDGQFYTIYKFESNNTGAQVIDEKGKKRGRKLAKLVKVTTLEDSNKNKNEPNAPDVTDSLEQVESSPDVTEEAVDAGGKKFEVLADPGESGDGYFPAPGTHLWGKYGAAGVMLRHKDENGTERFLLVQRGPMASSNKGKWQLPGGALDSKENDYQGTARELTEELAPPEGYLDSLAPAGEVKFEHPSGWHYTNIAADTPEQFDPHVDGTETGDAKWFTKDEIAQLDLHPALKDNLDKIFAEFGSDNSPEPGPAPEPQTTPDLPDTGEYGHVLDATHWSKVGSQGGSNLGGMFEDPNGKRYYVKKGKTPDHARNEALAAALYEAADVPASQQLLADTPFGGALGTVSPEIPGAKQDLKNHLNDPEYIKKLQDGFAVDAWLANWDVAGLAYDNVVTDEHGDPVRVDPGGALYFRAQGAPKPVGAWGPTVNELHSLRDPNMNPTSSDIFGSMTDDEIKKSAQHVVNVTPDQIDSIVDSMGFGDGVIDPEQMKATLKARREFIANAFGLTLPENAADSPSTPDATPAAPPADVHEPLADWEKELLGIPTHVNVSDGEDAVKAAVDDFMHAAATGNVNIGDSFDMPDQGMKVTYEYDGNGQPVFTLRDKNDAIHGAWDMAEGADKVGNDVWSTVKPQEMPAQAFTPDAVEVANAGTVSDIPAAVKAFHQLASDGYTNHGDYVQLPMGYKLTHEAYGSEDAYALHGPNGDVVMTFEPGYDSTEQIAQDIAQIIPSQPPLQPSPGTPAAYTANDINDLATSIPKQIGKVKQQFPGMTDVQAKQYRNASFALDDASMETPGSAKWHQAVNKAIYNLEQSGPHGSSKLAEVQKFKADVTGQPAPAPAVSEAPNVPAASTDPEDAWTANGGSWPVGTQVNSWGHDWVKQSDGSWMSKQSGETLPADSPDVGILEHQSHSVGDVTLPENYGSEPAAPVPDTPAVPVKTGPNKPGADGKPIYIGDKVKSVTDGKVYTVHKFENNGTGVQVIDENGNKRGRKLSKLVSLEEHANQPQQPAAPKVPKVAPKPTLEPDTSSPWYGKDKPSAPTKLDAGEEPWVQNADQWIAQAEQLYAAAPNTGSANLQSSSITWGRVQAVVNNGDTEALSKLLSRNRITQQMYDDALAQINKVKSKNAEADKKYQELTKQHALDVAAWKKANGIDDTSFPGAPALSTEEYTGGPANWDQALFGTPTANAALDSLKNGDADMAKRGVSVATDSDQIEDLDVRMMRVLDEDGNERIEMKFKLTSWAGDSIEKSLQGKQGVSTSYGIRLHKRQDDPATGLPRYVLSTVYSGEGTTYSYTDPSTGARVELSRAHSSKTKINQSALHNQVRVFMPANATSDDYENVLKNLGIQQSTPARTEDVRAYAINRLANLVGKTNPTLNIKDPAVQQQILDQVKSQFGITLDDLHFDVHQNGRVKLVLSDQARDNVVKYTNLHGLEHNVANGSVDTWMNILSGPMAGIQATHTRWSEGIGGHGMSSSPDMHSGGGDFVFTRPQHTKPTTAGYGPKVMIHPLAAARRLDLYGNETDNGTGKHYDGKRVYDIMKGHPYEIQLKQGVPLADIWYVTVSNANDRSALITALHAKGITEINGIPLEQFILTNGMNVPEADESRYSSAGLAKAL